MAANDTKTFENPVLDEDIDEEDDVDRQNSVAGEQGREKRRRRVLSDDDEEFFCDGKSLGCIGKDNPVRVAIFKFVHSRPVNTVILTAILINVSILVVQSPGNDYGDDFNRAAAAINLIFTIVFTIESLLRIFALGFCVGSTTYLRNPWCILDFVVVVCAWLSIATLDTTKPQPNVFRCLRAVRPVRSLRFFSGLKAILGALFNATVLLVEVLGFLLFFFCLFGAMGINLFQGALTHECADYCGTDSTMACEPFSMTDYTLWMAQQEDEEDRIIGWQECPDFLVKCPLKDFAKNNKEAPTELFSKSCKLVSDRGFGDGDRRDEVTIFGFNNAGTAFVTQFVATTMDDWPSLASPLRDTNTKFSWLVWPYFAVLTLVLAILTGNLFVSVICYAFGQLELEQGQKASAAAAVRKLRAMFDRFDTDGSGQITETEVGQIASSLDINFSDKELKEIMSQMDTDKSGDGQDEVDFEEFAFWWRSDSEQAVRLKRAFSAEEHKLKTVFLEVDVDRGGTLDMNEVRILGNKIGVEFTDEELLAAMADMDPNDDGDVDFDEFTAWWFGGSEFAQKVRSASSTEDAAIRRIFNDLCVDDVAEIKFETLGDLGKTLGLVLSKPEILDSLKEMDEDGGGTVDFEEFSHWWKSESKVAQRLRVKLQRQEAQVRVLFDRLDEDHGGNIGRDELAGIAKKIGMNLSADDLDEVMKEVDKDGTNEIDYDEFMVWWMSSSEVAATFKEKLQPFLKKESNPKWPFIPGVSPILMSLVISPVFDWFILFLVAVNAAIMAMDHYPEPDWLEDFMYVTEVFFCVVYTIEAICKIVGLGFMPYWRSGFNKLDLIIVVASIFGLIFPVLGSIAAFRGVRILVKLLRVMRLFKIMSKYDTVLMLLRTVLGSWHMLSNLVIFIIFSVAIFAVTGMHTLGFCHVPQEGVVAEHGQTYGLPGFPRENYYTMSDALVTTFQIMSGEDWAPVMYSYINCAGWYAIIYFMVAFSVTNFFLLNLFVAVILMNFEIAEEEKLIKQEKRYIQQLTDGEKTEAEKNAAVMMLRRRREAGLDPGARIEAEKARRALRKARSSPGSGSPRASEMNPDEGEGKENTALACFHFSNPVRKALIGLCDHWIFEAVVLLVIIASSAVLAVEDPVAPDDAFDTFNICVWAFFLLEFLLKIIAYGFMFTPRGYIMDSWNCLDLVILIISTVDTVNILTDQKSSGATRVLRLLRVLRPLRMIKFNEGMRVIVNSLIACSGMVLAVAALSMVFYMVFGTLGVHMFKGRFYRCSPGPIIGVPGLDEVDLIYATGVATRPWQDCPVSRDELEANQDFDTPYETTRKRFEYKPPEHPDIRCVEPANLNKQECEELCASMDGMNINLQKPCWSNPPYNFDNVFQSMRSLFITSTLEGWIDIMHSGMDAATEDGQYGIEPQLDNFYFSFFFFWMFVILGSYFTTNIFIGVMVNFFSESSGSGLLTTSQKAWVMKQLMLRQVRGRVTDIPEAGARRSLYDIVTSDFFEYGITFLVMLNVIVLVSEHFPQDESLTDTFWLLNFGFLIIYTIEAVLKIIALNPVQYILDSWCQLDAAILLVSWISTVIEGTGHAEAFQIFRALRILRIALVLKNSPTLKSLFGTLLLSLPPCANLTALLMLIYFMWGVLGMQFFGRLPQRMAAVSPTLCADRLIEGGACASDRPPTTGAYLHKLDNFDNIANAMMLLFQISTGQDWMNIMYEIQVELDVITPGQETTHSVGTFFYFSTFFVATVFVFLNLFIAVLLENFEMNFESNLLDLNEDHISEFKEIWIGLTDTKNTHMQITQVQDCLDQISEENPFKAVLQDPTWYNRMLFELDMSAEVLTEEETKITLHELLIVLTLLLHSYDGLTYDSQIEKRRKIERRQQNFASKIMAAHVRCYLACKKPPVAYFGRENTSPEAVKRYRTGAFIARTMLVETYVRTNKIAKQTES